MNERIRELAIKAGLLIETSDGWDVCIDDNLEDFARLIVRECGVALSPMLRDMVSRGKAYELIKEHFGIKE